MPSIAIYADSGMGKTMIMKRFRDDHPPSFNSLTGTLKTPVLAMEMTSRPGERRSYAELLGLLGAPPRAEIAQMEQAALRIIEAIGVQFWSSTRCTTFSPEPIATQRIVLNTLRFLSNRLHNSMVCFGVNEAREAISGDVQPARRFEQFTLNRWSANEQFETLMALICATRRCVDRRSSRQNRCAEYCRSPRALPPALPHDQQPGDRCDRERSEQITNEAVESWEPEFEAEAVFV